MTNLQRAWRGFEQLITRYDEYIEENNIELARRTWDEICTCLDFALDSKLITNDQYRVLVNIMFQARWKENCFNE